MTPGDLAIELSLDRAEAALTPDWLASSAATRLAARALAAADTSLVVRGHTLVRWSLSARADADLDVRHARTCPRDLAGLALRHTAWHNAARRLEFSSAAELSAAIHGRVPPTRIEVSPTRIEVSPVRHPDTDRVSPVRHPDIVRDPDSGLPTWLAYGGAVPDPSGVIAALAAGQGLEMAGIDLRRGAEASETVTVAPGHARMSIGAASDELAGLALALHEAGHALYRAQQGGMSLLAAAAPARWFDEALAAWAVRALEDPALVPDERIREVAAARRQHREHVTLRLAAFEQAALAGDAPDWNATGLRDPAAFPALFDEPGVMASYAAADRVRLDPSPGELRAWARAGASLDLAPWD